MGKVGMIGIMLAIEVVEVSCNTITKAAMTYGMSIFVSFVYFHLLALLFLLPTSFFLYRKITLPSITSSTLLRLFLLGLLNYLGMMLMFTGLNYSSPTLASVIVNPNPAFTFILAIFFGMENLSLKGKSSLFKLFVTIVLLTEAFTIIFYQGLPIKFSPSPDSEHRFLLLSMGANWVIGGFFLLGLGFEGVSI